MRDRAKVRLRSDVQIDVARDEQGVAQKVRFRATGNVADSWGPVIEVSRRKARKLLRAGLAVKE